MCHPLLGGSPEQEADGFPVASASESRRLERDSFRTSGKSQAPGAGARGGSDTFTRCLRRLTKPQYGSGTMAQQPKWASVWAMVTSPPMDDATKQKVLTLPQKIAGQVAGIAGLVEEARHSIDVLPQVASAQAKLGEAAGSFCALTSTPA